MDDIHVTKMANPGLFAKLNGKPVQKRKYAREFETEFEEKPDAKSGTHEEWIQEINGVKISLGSLF
jgi:hypothetical protein